MTNKIPNNPLRAFVRFILFIAWTIFMVIPVLLSWVIALESFRSRLVRMHLRGTLTILGIRLHVKGALAHERPLMLVSNHTGYLDIFVIGGLSRISFTPKREIRRWPIIGFMCVLADCVFVERRKSHMQEARDEMAERISQGKVLCLFPEGTTSDGKNLKPFKSGFISLAEDYNLPVQPVSIAYTHAAGIPLGDANRDKVAWIGEATLVVHFLRLIGFSSIDVTVIFHPAVQPGARGDRKELAKYCEDTIRATLQAELPHAG